MTAEDQIAVTGRLESGAVASLHYRGGSSRGTNLLWEINGTEGDLVLTGDSGHLQFGQAELRGARGDRRASCARCPCPATTCAGRPRPPRGRRRARRRRRRRRLPPVARRPAGLHDDNVLAPVPGSAREPWLAIDPKPLMGDAGFELLPALHDRWDDITATGDVERAVLRRFDLMTEVLGLDRQRAARRTLGRVLQNALWDVEDGEDALAPEQVEIARALQRRVIQG
ncbi:hypothetical protein MAUB1S_03679 [Mycolicibacterium aubagnense]